MSTLSKKYALILIVFLAIILRFYKLGENPPSLYWDEAAIGYNAYSILKTARDEHGTFLPLSFRSFDDYKSPAYIYTTVPSILLLGLNEFSVRLPSAIFGTFSTIVLYLFVLKLINNKKIALLSAFFLSTSPWHLHFSRAAFEANLMVLLILSGLTLFVYSQKRMLLVYLSVVAFGISLYSYNAARIYVPLLAIVSVALYIKDAKRLGTKIIIPALLFFAFFLPLLVNIKNNTLRDQSVSIFANTQHPFVSFVENYLSHFSLNFLFTTGDPIGRHSVGNMGELYLFQLPLILIGLILICKTLKRTSSKLIVALLIISPIPASLALPSPHAVRALMLAPIFSVICALGASHIAKIKSASKTRVLTASVLLAIGFYNLSSYLHLYYVHYPKEKSLDWQDGNGEAIQFINKIKDNYNSIAISNYYAQPYIYVLFYTKFDPKTYQTGDKQKNNFDKYEFFSDSWGKTKPGKALVVTPFWQAHPPEVLTEIHGQNDELIYRISQTE